MEYGWVYYKAEGNRPRTCSASRRAERSAWTRAPCGHSTRSRLPLYAYRDSRCKRDWVGVDGRIPSCGRAGSQGCRPSAYCSPCCARRCLPPPPLGGLVACPPPSHGRHAEPLRRRSVYRAFVMLHTKHAERRRDGSTTHGYHHPWAAWSSARRPRAVRAARTCARSRRRARRSRLWSSCAV